MNLQFLLNVRNFSTRWAVVSF